jgi:hypothetical protein
LEDLMRKRNFCKAVLVAFVAPVAVAKAMTAKRRWPRVFKFNDAGRLVLGDAGEQAAHSAALNAAQRQFTAFPIRAIDVPKYVPPDFDEMMKTIAEMQRNAAQKTSKGMVRWFYSPSPARETILGYLGLGGPERG